MKNKILTALLLVATPTFATPAPQLALTSFTDMPMMTMAPYDQKADAKKSVDAAFARAKKSGKRVLLDLGGNWCPDCIVLANFMQLPEMKPFLAKHFEFAAVDVGRFDKNLEIPARFGFTKRLAGVPMLLVATPDGKLLNGGNTFALTDARHMTPQSLAQYFGRWAD